MSFLHDSLQFQDTPGHLTCSNRVLPKIQLMLWSFRAITSNTVPYETQCGRRFSCYNFKTRKSRVFEFSRTVSENNNFAAVKGSRVYLSDASSPHHDDVGLPCRVEGFCLVRSRLHDQLPAFASPGSSFLWRPASRGTIYRCGYGWLRGPL